MQILSFLFDKHIDKTVLAVAVAMSLLLLTRSEESKVRSARAVSDVLLYPIHSTEKYFSDIDELREENRKLRRLSASLYHEREKLLQFKDERNRLRRLAGLREDSFFDFLPCEVTARSSNRFHNSVTIDRGGSDGVRVGMAVVGYRGVVGRVTQVFGSTSRVLLLNNKSISVSCRDKRSRVVGILEWDKGNLFKLEFIGKEEDVIVGDTLLTSGLGELFPKGFPLGTVFHVTEERSGLYRNVGVVSMANLKTLEELFVVVGGRDWENTRIYEELEQSLKD